MIQIAEMLQPQPSPLWKLVKQAGVDYAVGTLRRDPGSDENPWALEPLRRMQQRFADAGLTLTVIESTPPMDKIKMGLPGRDQEMDWFNEFVANLGQLGIPVICYNWMAYFNWLRTSVDIPARGGALVTGYDHAEMKDKPLTEYGIITEDQLWENLAWFLERAIPVAESANVKLAMHPDDPPLSPIRGIGRIMRSIAGFQRLCQLNPSPLNGITLCQGNFTLMTDDLPSVIRDFGKQGRIHFVHFRDVKGVPEKFEETFHDQGKTDMLACMRVYREIGFEGVLRPDHVPTLEGDQNDHPGYSSIGRLLAIGYIQGLRQAAYA